LRIQSRKAKKRSAGAVAGLQQAELELALAIQRARKISVGFVSWRRWSCGFPRRICGRKWVEFAFRLEKKGVLGICRIGFVGALGSDFRHVLWVMLGRMREEGDD